MILHHFCWRSSKIRYVDQKPLIFDQRIRKYPKHSQKYPKFLRFLGTPVALSGPLCESLLSGLSLELPVESCCALLRIVDLYGYGLATCRVGAQSGLGPGPGWGPYGSSWTGLGDSVRFPSTFRRDIWTNFARFGSQTYFLMKFIHDSASFLLEKLKNHIIFDQKP